MLLTNYSLTTPELGMDEYADDIRLKYAHTESSPLLLFSKDSKQGFNGMQILLLMHAHALTHMYTGHLPPSLPMLKQLESINSLPWTAAGFQHETRGKQAALMKMGDIWILIIGWAAVMTRNPVEDIEKQKAKGGLGWKEALEKKNLVILGLCILDVDFLWNLLTKDARLVGA